MPHSTFWTDLVKYWNSIPPQILSVAGFTAVLTLVYSIGYNRSKRPHFDFIFSYATGAYDANKDEYKWDIGGIIKNRSSNENSIVKIHRVAWKNNKRNSYLSDSLANIEIKDGNNNPLKLPIYFLKKQALSLHISTKFNVKGTTDEMVLRERIQVPTIPYLYLPKNKYELCFEDINGNFFDQNGKLINMSEADLWWTLVNTFENLKSWNIAPFLKHSLLIVISKILFFLKTLFWSIGM